MDDMEPLAIALAISAVVGAAVWLAAAAANSRRRRIDAVLADVQQRFEQGLVTPYQAACFTAVPAVEVAVWLLLERGDVLVSRDGGVRKAHVDRPVCDEDECERRDPFQEAVLACLASAPDGLKLHELADRPMCREASVAAQDFGVVDLPLLGGNNLAAAKAVFAVVAEAEHLLAARFVALGHEMERRALALYRARTPIEFPPGTPKRVVTIAANRSQSGSDAAFLMLVSAAASGGAAGGGGF